MEKENRVYITNFGGHNFNPAKQYGTLVPLTRGNINPVQTDRILVDMLDVLKDSTENDYLLLSGHPVTIIIATSIMFTFHEKVKFLVWNKYNTEYVVREVSKSQIEESYKIING